MILKREVDIRRMRNMFGKIILGEHVELEIMRHFTIPNTKNTVNLFLDKHEGLAIDEEELFHFVTFFTGFVYKLAPIANKDYITEISVTKLEEIDGALVLEVSYNLD